MYGCAWKHHQWCHLGSLGVSGRNIRHPHPGDLTRNDQILACVPAAFAHGSALLIHSHPVVLSVASVAALLTFLFAFALGRWSPALLLLCWVIAVQILCNPLPEVHSKVLLLLLLLLSTNSWFPLVGLIHSLFPGHCELQDDPPPAASLLCAWGHCPVGKIELIAKHYAETRYW